MRKAIMAGVWLCTFIWVGMAWGGALENYVNEPDPTYAYSVVSSGPGVDCTVYVVDMTSQTWHPNDVDKPVWRHWVMVFVPNRVETETALLIITGGNNKHDRPPTVDGKEAQAVSNIVSKTGGVVVMLKGVPSEPLVFNAEGKSRTEDEIIAYTYRQYVDTGDPTWPLLLPMVKSAVRAMDTSQDLLKKVTPAVNVKDFVVTGASKRGWTTWLTGAIDPRVAGIAPMVIDMLNTPLQMAHQKEWYGTYSSEVQDYTDLKLTDFMASPDARPLLDIVDPYSYRDTLTMPKLVLLGSGDQYWTLDAANFYFPGLLAPKYIRYQANGDHGLDTATETIKALTHFFNCVAKKKPMPEFTWDIKPDGTYLVTPGEPRPEEVRLWRAHSDVLDFRKITVGDSAFSSEVLTANPDGTYSGRVKAPKEGYDGFYIELVYRSLLGFDYSLTTTPCVPERSTNVLGIALAVCLPLLLIGAVGWVMFK
ncbi:MAG: PhoPQ-activated protein PqaA family protein [FCB group bacterium]|jgi:PhoPQ-activated pathogenicity-related protein|nr:PhoPQ-activated protein PqaA family protein [FCB group bacterium]